MSGRMSDLAKLRGIDLPFLPRPVQAHVLALVGYPVESWRCHAGWFILDRHTLHGWTGCIVCPTICCICVVISCCISECSIDRPHSVHGT